MKEQILIMGKKLFYKDGYSKTKITKITKKLGISTGNFYTYYSSKEILLNHILKRELEVVDREYRTAINIEGNLGEVFKNFILSIISVTEDLKELMLLKIEIEKNINKFNDITISILKDYDEILPKYIKRILKKKVVKIDNLDLIVELIYSEIKICLKNMLENQSIKGMSFYNKKIDTEVITKLAMYICDVFELKYKEDEKYDKLTQVYTEDYFFKLLKKIYSEGDMKDSAIYIIYIQDYKKSKESFFFNSIMQEIPRALEKNIKSKDLIGLKDDIYFMIYTKDINNIDVIKSLGIRLQKLLSPIVIKYFPNRSEEDLLKIISVEVDGKDNFVEVEEKINNLIRKE